MKKENLGVLYGILAAMIYGFFPVLLHHGTQSTPPITFIAIGTLLGGVTAFIYALYKKKLGELKNTAAYFPLMMVTLFIVIIPWALISIGSSMTTGVNTSLLLLIEIFYTMIFTHFIGETTTRIKVLGAVCVLLGSVLIAYNGSLVINRGDLLILLAPLFFPIGNFYSKRALQVVSPETITYVRYILGGLFFLLMSLILEPTVHYGEVIKMHWGLLLGLGVIAIGARTIIAYASLRRLDISKFIFIANVFPISSLIILVVFFDEVASLYQLIGFIVIMIGLYFAVKRQSVDQSQTRYRLQT